MVVFYEVRSQITDSFEQKFGHNTRDEFFSHNLLPGYWDASKIITVQARTVADGNKMP